MNAPSVTSPSLPALVLAGLDLSGLAPLHPVLPHVVMYTLPHCSTCDRLKILFKAAKLPVVAVPLDIDDDAHRLFSGELGVKQTPIVVVHNTFEDVSYFSGFNSGHARLAITSVFSRLRDVEESAAGFSVEGYMSELAASIEPGHAHPFVRADMFATLAARHLPSVAAQPPRCTVPALLSRNSVVLGS
ncbi:MAG: hypothetical protein DI630_00140 [Gordonia sp. (in: high G+C Gram-positive bacteria)]|nr:MAG: hypothetical protein DI630_00140 [Gordonia sp. (in: high G+C Gram-positive bacteria)]